MTHKWFVGKNYEAGEVVALADWLKEHTDDDHRVFHWGFDPSVNYIARRHTVTRFLYNYPFRVSWSDPAYRVELLDGLAADRPEWFVAGDRDSTKAVTGNRKSSYALLKEWEELYRFVRENYVMVKKVERYRVYQRRDLLPKKK